MKKIISILIFIPLIIFSQIQTMPEFPTQEDSIKIIFDATKASRDDLVGYTGTLYTHTGVKCSVHGDWQHVIGTWGSTSQPKLQRIGTDLYELKIGNPKTFYKVTSPNDTIEQLNFVFRSSDSQLQSEDIFVPLFKTGLNVKIVAPESSPEIYSIGDTLKIKSISLGADSTRIKINNTTVKVGLSDTTYFSQIIDSPISGTIKVEAYKNNSFVSDEKDFVVIKNSTIADLPHGVDYGINYTSNRSAILALHAPSKKVVHLIGDFNNWKLLDTYQMNISPDSSTWWIELNDLTPNKEYAFQYVVNGTLRIADPYAEKVLDPNYDKYIDDKIYPGLKEYPYDKTDEIVSILQTNQDEYNWSANNYIKPKKNKLIIYELLVRDFVSTHNYNTIIDTLNYLERLGINAIELMPINEFEGNESWGYNPSFYFAPDKYYGPKETLQKLIDECHKRNIAVIIDMVLNHSFGQNPMVRLYFDKYENNEIISLPESPWYNIKSPNRDFYWGADFNHESIYTQQFIDRVNKFWLTEYKVDGFRFDFTKGFTNRSGNGWSYDASRIKILKRMASSIWQTNPDAFIILEHLTDNSEEKELSNYGIMLWGNMNYNYNEATMGYHDGGKSNLARISYKSRGWTEPNLVGYMESHDEERLMYKNLQYGNSFEDYKIQNLNISLQRIKLASTFFYTVPGPKMLWMFGELGYDISIDDPCRVCNKPILWNYQDIETRNNLYKTIASLTYLKNNYDIFSSENFSMAVASEMKRINLSSDTANVAIVGNFGVKQNSVAPMFQKEGIWYDYFSGDSILINDVNAEVELEAGEFHIYSTIKFPKPENDIISNITYSKTDLHTFHLNQNYPNPFNPTTTISYIIPNNTAKFNSHVQLNIYDILGRKISTLVNEVQPAGSYKVQFNAEDLSAGVYIYRLNVGAKTSSKKMMLLK